jgi:hypothetical protein
VKSSLKSKKNARNTAGRKEKITKQIGGQVPDHHGVIRGGSIVSKAEED